MTSSIDDHADKYNDPRAQISRRGVWIGLMVVVFGICGSAFSIWARRTRLERSTEFWGPEVIQAFQLAAEVEMLPQAISPQDASPQDSAAKPLEPQESSPDADADGTDANAQVEPTVRLTGMPGLGHLRHVLLDDRSYLWESVQNGSISTTSQSPELMVLRFSDPTARRFPDARIVVDLVGGWVAMEDGTQKVRLNDRFRNALPTFLKRIANYEPIRVEMREKKNSGG